MTPTLDYDDATSTKVCRRCGVRGNGPHETAEQCIDALRMIIARLEFRQEEHEPEQKRPASARGGRRERSDNRMVLLDGERLCLTVAARRLGISTAALHYRIVARTGTKEYAEVDLRAISIDVLRAPTGARG